VDPGELDPGRNLAAGANAIALLDGQLLESLERPKLLPSRKQPAGSRRDAPYGGPGKQRLNSHTASRSGQFAAWQATSVSLW